LQVSGKYFQIEFGLPEAQHLFLPFEKNPLKPTAALANFLIFMASV
jgi:hypothetical protein